MAKSLSVSVVSAAREVWTGEVTMVVAKTVEGEIGILAGHEPMLAILAVGDVRLTLDDGSKVVARAEDGFLSVDNDTVTIVARKAELVGS
ncbi:MAG: F0F1 ATP synthase subunit epsilon [Cryobacterium sp.]|uniref:F0F1 ATP synthase subunit epsilon n=1 Tax=unclassified Cryobacterium TaxID=2649013 RepID=UPI0018CA0D61|nr:MULTISPECIES: F0F1 ATP synthase subunit epsilon [unclassified Cryobacterium]MCY7405135.1 F0F1 ATP synthase subunit epsilon [Cryobacterium sp.]MEC5155216.1 F-type H+-transporting ATPase subunit epsilon [Cryobacterium sp. CAN_C3]